MPGRRGELRYGDKFTLFDGDGDQSFLSTSKTLKLTKADWFTGQLEFGPALLFVIQDGEFKGEYIALTARGMRDLWKAIRGNGYATVVVHRLANPGKSFDASRDTLAIGMSYVERL